MCWSMVVLLVIMLGGSNSHLVEMLTPTGTAAFAQSCTIRELHEGQCNIIYIKVPKCMSSTVAGALRRVATQFKMAAVSDDVDQTHIAHSLRN